MRRAFTTLCGIEMLERLAYFSVRYVIPLYIMQADDAGGLRLTAGQKGQLLAAWFAVQCRLSALIGGDVDRYGHKKAMSAALLLLMAGYLSMAFVRSYAAFFAAVLILAAGTALFKPSLQGSLARALPPEKASLGWGIFFWIVNVGSLLSPFLATLILGPSHDAQAWRNLFLVAAGLTAVNLILACFLRDAPTAVPHQSPTRVLITTLRHLMQPRLLVFFLLLTAYWTVAWQLFDMHLNFITDWVDSTMIAQRLRWLPGSVFDRIVEIGPEGPRIPAQILVGSNTILIIIFVVPLSWLSRQISSLSALTIGFALTTLGISAAGLTRNGWVLLAGIGLFAFGSMLTDPKQLEYLGLLAPEGEKARYLGYLNLPVGLGGIIGAWMAGYLYGHHGEKATLALRYLFEHGDHAATSAGPMSASALESALDIERADAMTALASALNLDASAATQLLWDTYHPHYHIWSAFMVIGYLAVAGMIVFKRSKCRVGDGENSL